ncbi:MAG: protease modulator HflC [Proteobacteria bacterium]|nr:protease modulator HflC [Pseudomonadota bacterium]
MGRVLFPALILAAVLVATVWAGNLGLGPLVINRESEFRIVQRFGNPVSVMTEPSWGLRVPLLDSVRVFDSRLQYLDAQAVEMLISRGEKLIVDYYVVWRIGDPLLFLQSFPGGMEKAKDRIQSRVNAQVGAKIGGLSLAQILQRAEILDTLAAEAEASLRDQGIEVVDVRLNRTELPRKAEPAAYEQMREQRRAIARAERVEGEREARTIRAAAEREARTTVAAARSRSEILRGEGDARSASIYAAAYNRDPEFYAFVRSLEAYRKSLGERTTMVLPPDHEFFRFLEPGIVAAPGTAGR